MGADFCHGFAVKRKKKSSIIEEKFVFVQSANRPAERKTEAVATLRGNTDSVAQNIVTAPAPENTTYCVRIWIKKAKSFIMAQ